MTNRTEELKKAYEGFRLVNKDEIRENYRVIADSIEYMAY